MTCRIVRPANLLKPGLGALRTIRKFESLACGTVNSLLVPWRRLIISISSSLWLRKRKHLSVNSQSPEQSKDDRFWKLFEKCADELITDEASSRVIHWLTLDGKARVVNLLSKVRAARKTSGFDEDEVREIALRGLLYTEPQADDVSKIARERLDELRRLVRKKGEDYNAGGISALEYWILGADSIFHEMHKRCLRLVSLSQHQSDRNLRRKRRPDWI